jgi:TPR repeat protein
MYRTGLGVEQDINEAMRFLIRSAENNFVEAQYELAFVYDIGMSDGFFSWSLDMRDINKSVYWYGIALQNGDIRAASALGSIYFFGKHGQKDYNKSFQFYKIAAAQGDANAQFILGESFDDGRGVVQDYAEAVRWYRLAAEQGYISAQASLGFKYILGEGVMQNYITAHMWLNLAAAKGNEYAIEDRKLIQENMSVEQIAEAQKRASACLTNNYKNC